MAAPAERRATYEDLLAVPATLVAQILDGALITQPRPAIAHALASSSLGAELSGPFQRARGGPGGWIILDEPELHLDADVVVPDLAGWRRERLPELPSGAAFTLAPDWICEVLSPSTAAIDKTVKRRIYGREGVRWLWLVDPDARTLEVFALESSAWTLVGTWQGDDAVRATPFDAIEFDLSVLWKA
jgi:Uma2 family endonuclease